MQMSSNKRASRLKVLMGEYTWVSMKEKKSLARLMKMMSSLDKALRLKEALLSHFHPQNRFSES
jgi:hypothetical protein